jgi:hypothetical protein
MKFLKIRNKGILDIRLVSLMGGSTKTGNSYKIGQFGTGLKYSFAYLLRNNVAFYLYLGDRRVSFHTEPLTIQDTPFDVIYIDDKETSLTTNMGPDWKAWMIIRELWCNALDETDPMISVVNEEEIDAVEGYTTFYIQMITDFIQVHREWSKYFIHDRQPMFRTKDGDLAVYAANSQSLMFYKQGVLIREYDISTQDRKYQPVFAYDQKYAKINELREFMGTLSQEVTKILSSITDEDTIRYFYENVNENSCEATMDLNWWNEWSPAWSTALQGRKLIHPELVQQLTDKGILIDLNTVYVVPKNVYKIVTGQFKETSAVIVTGTQGSEFIEKFSEACQLKIDRALMLLASSGYEMTPGITYHYGYFTDDKTLARVDKLMKIVYVSNVHADRDMFDVMTMLVEENEHIKTGYADQTRAFQQHFIDLYVNAITEKTIYK